MTTQMFLRLGTFLFMILEFLLVKKLYTTLVVVSICTIVSVTSFGIILVSVVLSKFADHNIPLIVGMVVASAGFSHTQAVNKFSNLVFKINKGSFGMQMFGYCVLVFLLTNLIPSPIATFGVMVPVIATSCKKDDISPPKVMQPIALVCICSVDTALSGSGMYTYATANSVMESYGYADYAMRILDPAKGQLIISAVLAVYAAFIAPELASSQPSASVTLGGFTNRASTVDDVPSLDPVREVLGYGILLLAIVGPISADTLGLQSWQIVATGAALITAVGVLKTQEAIDAIPASTILMLIVAYAAGGATEACGLGDMIGSLLASALGNMRNGHIIGFAFFVIPFLLTQFMQNFSIDNLFQPIIIMASKVLGYNPVGLLFILGSACNSALMTPMSTGAIPSMMEAGGYDQKGLSKMGWLPSILMCVLSVLVIMMVFPVFP